MAHIKWQSDLDTGIDVIDDQHRRLVDMINKLHDAQLNHDNKEVGEVLNDVIDYTISHFAFEESLLEEAGYEFLRPHRKVHELFVRRVQEYADRYRKGEDIADELVGLLSRWLLNHIRNDDAAYVRAVKDNMIVISSDRKRGGWLSRAIGSFFK